MYSSLSNDFGDIMILLAYDLDDNKSINEEIVTFVKNGLKNEIKIGAATLSSNQALRMEVAQRDLPGDDINYLLICAKKDTSSRRSLCDAINHCSFRFNDDKNKHAILVILLEHIVKGVCKIEDFRLISAQGIKIFVLARQGVLNEDFRDFKEFMESEKHVIIEFGNKKIAFFNALTEFHKTLMNYYENYQEI